MSYRSDNLKAMRAYEKAYRDANPQKMREKATAWRAAHPKEYREYHRQRAAAAPSVHHGLTRAEVHARLKEQGGVCAICETSSPGRGKWHGDHDHKANVFRGVLCGRCNLGLGLFKDSIVLLRNAGMYLRRKL